jgi:Carboxypeptidase regulatory-like domain
MSIRKLYVLCFMIVLTVVRAFSQAGVTGTITGSVVDSTGSVIGNASVIVTNIATGVNSHTQTTGSGEYTLPDLNPGTYRVTVESPGFERSVVNNVGLIVAQTVRLNVRMMAGVVSETVTVESNAVALDTDSSAISQIVTNQQVVELPINGRNFLQLLYIGAGAVTVGAEQGTMRQGEGAAVSINGARPESNNYILDGMVNTDQALNTPAVVLSIDAIQEFKEQTAISPAQYGFSANQVNISSKSGTNQLHGSVFYFGRNDFFDAQNYFNLPGTHPLLRQHQFGFVVGGPVIIPGLYNGRNKTFFLANYEGERIESGNITFQNEPNSQFLQGNFTALAANPANSACVPGNAVANCIPIDPTTGKRFPGDIIPAGRFSRVANVAISAGYFDAPNCPGLCNGFNHEQTPILPTSSDQQTYRIDRDMGRFGRLFGRYSQDPFHTQSQDASSLVAGRAHEDEIARNSEASWTMSFGPRIVNNFIAGYLEADSIDSGVPVSTADTAALGLTGTYTGLADMYRTAPKLGFGNQLGENLGAYGGGGNSTIGDSSMEVFSDTVTMSRGNHTVTMGAEYRHWLLDRNLAVNPLGGFTYSDYWSGNQVADFDLGYYSAANVFQPSGASSSQGNPREFHFSYFAPYIQDDWKATPNLTINAGLRWDYRPFPYETHNHMGWLDVTNPNGGLCIADQSLVTSGVTAPAPGFGTFYRYCGRKNPAPPEKFDFGPRFGFAYRPFGDEKTVLRGGYGLYWDALEGKEIDGSADIYPYLIRTSLTQSPGTGLIAGLNTTNNLFVNYSSTVGPAIPGLTGVDTFLAVVIPEKPHNSYMQQYSLSIQRELARNTTFEVNYIGNKGTHLLSRIEINQAEDPSAACIAAPTSPGCSTLARQPYPYFSTFIDSTPTAYSNYNSMNLKFEHRAHQTSITSIFTWAKSMDDKSVAGAIGADAGGYQGYMNNHNPNLDYGPSEFDVDKRFVTSVVYDLPFGRGKRFLGGTGGLTNAVIGGWEVNGIYTAQTGFPFSVLATDISGFLGTASQRANKLPGNSSFKKSRSQWIDKSAYSQPLEGYYGTSSRNYLRQPGINNFDLALFKNLGFLHESAHLQLRLEAFNALNHPQFYPNPALSQYAAGGTTVDTNVNDAAFGQVNGASFGREVQLGAKIVF